MTWRIALIALAIAAGLCAVAAVITSIQTESRKAGAASERAQITKENTNAGEKAERARGAYDDCDASGGLFDFAKSACRH